MGLLDRFFKRKNQPQTYARNSSREQISYDDFGGTRQSVPKFTKGSGGAFSALPRRTQRDLGLDERRFNSYSIEDLVDILIDAHPDMSFALWNFLRIGTTNYSYSVTKIGSDKRDKRSEQLIKELFDRLEMPNITRFEKSRSIDKIINQLMLSAVVRGACALELVLTPDYDDVAFLAPVDPATIEFKFEDGRFIPYQNDVKLDIPTFIYEGLDERIDDPYGRSPILSALHMILFQLQVLNDIKAAVHNQGYPRYDITILEEVLLNRMPISIRNNEVEKQKWLNARLREIIDMYNSLEPDDSFVHFDSVSINMVGGKSGGASVIDPEKLMNAIDHLIMSGLKTLSTILGRRSTGNTESFAKMEIKLYLKGVEAIQDVVERVMSKALTLYLNIRGRQGIVKFKFSPVEIRTEIEKAQFEQIALSNYAFMRDQGWIDQYEAAMRAVGHEPVSETPLDNSPLTNKEGDRVSSMPDERGANSPTERP